MSNPNPIASLATRSAELRQEQDKWQSKNTIQRLFAREKFNETLWKQRVKDLFDQNLFEYLDDHPSSNNLTTLVTELDKFKNLLDYNFLIFIWNEVKQRSSMAGPHQRKFDELIDLQIKRAENVKAMVTIIDRLQNRP